MKILLPVPVPGADSNSMARMEFMRRMLLPWLTKISFSLIGLHLAMINSGIHVLYISFRDVVSRLGSRLHLDKMS